MEALEEHEVTIVLVDGELYAEVDGEVNYSTNHVARHLRKGEHFCIGAFRDDWELVDEIVNYCNRDTYHYDIDYRGEQGLLSYEGNGGLNG